ncbi:MAG: acylphosphatase [Spirochaetales bacterium]|nr:acylphosphatase [Spirochaetales bacterium]
MEKAYLLRVSGRVQGVGFRFQTHMQARRLGIMGWVKNMPDGSVEVFCEGESTRLDTFLKWVKKGPQGTRVDLLKKREVPSKGCMTFTIEY